MLPKQNRLTSTKDFQNVTKTGVRVYSDIAVIYALANPTSQKNSEVGLIVSKVVGNSVVRHKVSRHIRNVVKEILETIPGNIQIVIRALPAITEKEFTEINKILSESISKSIAKAIYEVAPKVINPDHVETNEPEQVEEQEHVLYVQKEPVICKFEKRKGKATTIIAASICGTFSLDFCIGTECSIIVQVPIVF